MIAVGKKTAQTLSQFGISVLHCTIMHDAESYNDSYNYAAKSIKSFIAQYPSISYVLDLHRDAIQYEDGSIARPTIKTDLGDTAQLMFVIGTDELGANHPNWEKNLSLAVRLQSALNSKTANLVRPISPVSYTHLDVYKRQKLRNDQYEVSEPLCDNSLLIR